MNVVDHAKFKKIISELEKENAELRHKITELEQIIQLSKDKDKQLTEKERLSLLVQSGALIGEAFSDDEDEEDKDE